MLALDPLFFDDLTLGDFGVVAVKVGIAFVVPFFNSFSMFLGALLVWLWGRSNEKSAESYAVPIASGLIAGESLIAVGIAAVTGGG